MALAKAGRAAWVAAGPRANRVALQGYLMAVVVDLAAEVVALEVRRVPRAAMAVSVVVAEAETRGLQRGAALAEVSAGLVRVGC